MPNKHQGNALPLRVGRLEAAQRETNRRLGRIENTLGTASRVLKIMDDRLEHLEEGQKALVEGQKQVIDRLDRLIRATVA